MEAVNRAGAIEVAIQQHYHDHPRHTGDETEPEFEIPNMILCYAYFWVVVLNMIGTHFGHIKGIHISKVLQWTDDCNTQPQNNDNRDVLLVVFQETPPTRNRKHHGGDSYAP